MINICLANTRHRAAVELAARALGLKFAARMFSANDLMDLRSPVLVVFDEGGSFTPDFLQYLRRTHRGGVRYSPALVFCPRREACNAWIEAGAVAVPEKADEKEVFQAMRLAMLGERRWVTSAIYVGPDRRLHASLFKLKKRRSEDTAASVARAVRSGREHPGEDVPVSSIDRLHRRISFAAQLLSGSTIESRRAFQTLIAELDASVRAHHRHDLASIVAELQEGAQRLIADANADTSAIEDAVARLGEGATRALR